MGVTTVVEGAPVHEPVLTAEVIDALAPSRGGVFVDCTVGLGGHARALLEGGASARSRQTRLTLSPIEARRPTMPASRRGPSASSTSATW